MLLSKALRVKSSLPHAFMIMRVSFIYWVVGKSILCLPIVGGLQPKQKGAERDPLSYSSTIKGFSKCSIEKNRKVSNPKKKHFHPSHPLGSKTFGQHDLYHSLMLNLVKCLLKVEPKNDKFFHGVMTKVKVIKRPSKAILHSP